MATNSLLTSQIFIVLIISIIVAIVLIYIAMQWRNVKKYESDVKILEQEIELKKISLVEKDLESKKFYGSSINLPKEKQDKLSEIRNSTSKKLSEIGFLETEINERLSNLEAQTEYKKLEKMLDEIKEKEKKIK